MELLVVMVRSAVVKSAVQLSSFGSALCCAWSVSLCSVCMSDWFGLDFVHIHTPRGISILKLLIFLLFIHYFFNLKF